ncbi:MAG: hypothetical protein F6K42_26495, partial [Leptolyngbya sp. SIO1D8]|nr:hypothetical protein [Leptolyngbya sp. SIO1D8]
MENQPPRRRPPLGIIIALVAIALGAGSATAWFTWRAISPSVPTADFPEIEIEGETLPEGFEAPSSEPINVPDPPETDIAAEPIQRQGKIYWVSMQGEAIALAPVEVDLPEADTSADTLTLAFADLMTGPAESEGEAATSIPEQTELVALTVESDGIHVDLSDEFTIILRIYPAHRSWIRGIAFSPVHATSLAGNEFTLASSSHDFTVK